MSGPKRTPSRLEQMTVATCKVPASPTVSIVFAEQQLRSCSVTLQ